MIRGKKVIVVLPAYNAGKTLEPTYHELPMDIVDDVILVDDFSNDDTVKVAKNLGIQTIVHIENLGYGANQKTCYKEALKRGADIVVMVHPDYQYAPKLVAPMAYLIATDEFDVVLGSRILSGGALAGGMPLYKYVSNRFLTMIQNLLVRQKLSEYHTGYRAFSRNVLETLPLEANDNDFIFDNQMLCQIIHYGFRIGEMTCPTKYFPEASSINLVRSTKYGIGVLKVSLEFFLCHLHLIRSKIFPESSIMKDQHIES